MIMMDPFPKQVCTPNFEFAMAVAYEHREQTCVWLPVNSDANLDMERCQMFAVANANGGGISEPT